MDAINALERLYRRTQAWDRLVDVLSQEVADRRRRRAGDQAAAAGRRAVGGAAGRQRPRGRGLQGGADGRSAEPAGPEGARARCTRRPGSMEALPRVLEHQLEVIAARGGRVALYQRMATIWEENFGKPDRATEVLREDPADRRAQPEGVPRPRAPVPPGAQVGALVDNYRNTSWWSTTDTTERIDLYAQDGPGLRGGAARPRPRHRGLQRRAPVEADHVDALRGPGAPVRGDRAVGSRRRHDAAADPRQQPTRGRRSTSTTAWARSSTSRCGCRRPPRSTWSRRCRIDPTHVPSMLSLLGIYKRRGDWLKAAQLMVRAEAAHQQPAGEDAPAVRGGQDLPARSWATRRRRPSCSRASCSSIPSTSRRPSRCRELYFKREEWAPLVPDPRDAGAQGRSQDQPRADAAVLPAGQGGRPAGRQREGAQVLQAGLRPRLDLPADAARSGRRCSTGCEHWDDAFKHLPDDPGPPPRGPEGRSTSSTSSSASGRSS